MIGLAFNQSAKRRYREAGSASICCSGFLQDVGVSVEAVERLVDKII